MSFLKYNLFIVIFTFQYDSFIIIKHVFHERHFNFENVYFFEIENELYLNKFKLVNFAYI